MERLDGVMKQLLKLREAVIDEAIAKGAVNMSHATYQSVEALIEQIKADAAFALMHPEEEE